MPQPTTIIDAVEKHGRNTGDTGATAVQIAVLTERVAHLTEHLRNHKHDHHTRQGLYKVLGQRRKLARYYRDQNVEAYRELIATLGIRDPLGPS